MFELHYSVDLNELNADDDDDNGDNGTGSKLPSAESNAYVDSAVSFLRGIRCHSVLNSGYFR